MFGERLVEIPWLFKNLKDGSILDIGSAEASYNYKLMGQGRTMTLVDIRKDRIKVNTDKVKVIQQDIRKIKVEDMSKFDNILLISTLEHIGLTAYDGQADWKDSPALEQLRTFRHCMNFLKEDGQMLLTLPYGKYEHGGWLLVYDKKMIEDIKEGYKIIDERYFTLKKGVEDKYIECQEEECPLLGVDMVSGQGLRATSVVCLVMENIV